MKLRPLTPDERSQAGVSARLGGRGVERPCSRGGYPGRRRGAVGQRHAGEQRRAAARVSCTGTTIRWRCSFSVATPGFSSPSAWAKRSADPSSPCPRAGLQSQDCRPALFSAITSAHEASRHFRAHRLLLIEFRRARSHRASPGAGAGHGTCRFGGAARDRVRHAAPGYRAPSRIGADARDGPRVAVAAAGSADLLVR